MCWVSPAQPQPQTKMESPALVPSLRAAKTALASLKRARYY